MDIIESKSQTDSKILQESPLDETAGEFKEEVAAGGIQHWVPSRYTVRANAEDGQLILWNTLSSTMIAFKPEQASYVLALLKPAGVESREEGLVGYLVKRGFLIPKDTNEYRKFLLAFGQQHYQSDRMELFVLSSEDCNFRCKYCYEEFARGTMRPEIRRGIKRLVEKRIENLKVLDTRWFGGEPLYGWAAVEELAPFFSEIAREHGVKHLSHMTTNGYLLTEEVVEKLLSWNMNRFQVTIDGIPETHDCNRPTRDGRSTFWTIFENLKAMSRRRDDFAVLLRVNFDKGNKDRLEEFLDLVRRDLRDDPRFRLTFAPVGQWGGPNDAQLDVCGKEEQNDVAARMREAAHARGLHISTLKDVNYLGGMVCYAARPFNLIVGASGKVMKCTVLLDTDERNVVGQLKEDGTLLLNKGRMAQWTEPAFERDDQCQRCVVLPSCQGISCPLPRIAEDTRPCVPTRNLAKSQLREVFKYQSRAARTREVQQKDIVAEKA